MCLGIPMKILAYEGDWAVCEGDGGQRLVDMMLIGRQPPGAWVLVFLDTARELLSEQQAGKIADALKAVDLALRGQTRVDHLFADLVDRTPQLPDFLRPEVE